MPTAKLPGATTADLNWRGASNIRHSTVIHVFRAQVFRARGADRRSDGPSVQKCPLRTYSMHAARHVQTIPVWLIN